MRCRVRGKHSCNPPVKRLTRGTRLCNMEQSSEPCFSQTLPCVPLRQQARPESLEAALPSVTVPVGILVGEGSPIPTTAGTDTADRIPGAWSYGVAGAGHFVWLEAPGSVLAAMDRLTAGTAEA